MGGTGGGESNPGEDKNDNELVRLLGMFADLGWTSFSLILEAAGGVDPFKFQDPKRAFARQLVLTFERLATVSELLIFSA